MGSNDTPKNEAAKLTALMMPMPALVAQAMVPVDADGTPQFDPIGEDVPLKIREAVSEFAKNVGGILSEHFHRDIVMHIHSEGVGPLVQALTLFINSKDPESRDDCGFDMAKLAEAYRVAEDLAKSTKVMNPSEVNGGQ